MSDPASSEEPTRGSTPSENDVLMLKPIGFIRTGKNVKFKARHQPVEESIETNVLELLPVEGYAEALHDLEGFDRVWLIWWFHRNKTWRPMVLPPRGRSQRRGLFATRSPHRPNALGMTPVRLLGVKKRTLILGPCDLVDGTPVFDIKPYVPAYDSFPGSKAGWIETADLSENAPAAFRVRWSELAEAQRKWLATRGCDTFCERMVQLLERDPTPHRTRRIKRRDDESFVISCGEWRAVFRVDGAQIFLLHIESGFPLQLLTSEHTTKVPAKAEQLAFHRAWPEFSS